MTDHACPSNATNAMPRGEDGASAVPESGLPGPEPLGPIIERQLSACRRNGTMLAVLSISLHGLDAVRHCHGAVIEAQVRQAAWARLRSRLRGSDLAVHIGGDAYGAVLLNAGRLAAGLVDSRVAGALCEPYGIDTLGIVISVRSGVAVFPQAGSNGAALAAAAAQARVIAGATPPHAPSACGGVPDVTRAAIACTTP